MSIWPLLLAVGLALLVAGVVSSLIVSLLGLIFTLVSVGGWIQETRLFAQEEGEPEEEARHE